MKRQTRLDLAHHPSSARAVRRAVSEFCEGLDVDVGSVSLCATELLTNALLHGKPPLALEMAADETTLRVSVFDGGDGQVAPRGELAAVATSGRGLAVVDELASRWGTERTAPSGKVVWLEVEVGPG